MSKREWSHKFISSF